MKAREFSAATVPTSSTTSVLEGKVTVESARARMLSGWMGLFAAGYGDRSFLSTKPPIHGSSWENVLSPLGEPIPVNGGDSASMALRIDDPFWSWTARVAAREVREFSELHAMPERMLRPATSRIDNTVN